MTMDNDLDQFVASYLPRLTGYLRGKADDDDLHDLAHDCMQVLVAKHSEVQKWDAFLFKVASNKLKQYYAQNKRRNGFLSAVLDLDAMPMQFLSTRLSVRVARNTDVERALGKLNLRQYQVVQLRYSQNLDIADVADALEISPATVKRETTRARAVLGAALGHEVEEQAFSSIIREYVKR